MGKVNSPFAILEKKVFKIHDKVCNQKYADTLPYSTHLKFVKAQGRLFFNLLETDERLVVEYSLVLHDIIEDGRYTYNDVKDLVNKCSLLYNKKDNSSYDYKRQNYNSSGLKDLATDIADVVYCVTDEKGKSRKERKSDKYYAELKENELAIFVKLADLAANTLFSKLSGNPMYGKYKREFPNFKEKLYVEKFKIFFDYIENI